MNFVTLSRRATLKLLGSSLLPILIPLAVVFADKLQAAKALSLWAIGFFLLGSLTFLGQALLKRPLTELLFVVFQPLSTLLLYLSFTVIFIYLGPAWELVGLTMLLFWSLWLIPLLLPNFASTYSNEYRKPKAVWGKVLFRYSLFPLLLLSPVSAATVGRLSSRFSLVPGLIFVALLVLLIAFTFQFYLITATWPNTIGKLSRTKQQ